MKSAYEFYGSKLCVRKPFLTDEAKIMSRSAYDNFVKRGHLRVVRNGGGPGRCALILMDEYMMRPDIYKAIVAKEPVNFDIQNELQQYIVKTSDAPKFFANYRKPNGRLLTFKESHRYTYNAFVLDACKTFIKKNPRMKITKAWMKLSDLVNTLEGYDIKLPGSAKALQKKFNEYISQGPEALIHGGTGNNNSRKVDDKIEKLLLSIYATKNKPYVQEVHQLYYQFIGGVIDVVNTDTGELFDPKDFMKDNRPVDISEATAWNYINDPKNRTLVDRSRSGSMQYNGKHRPHHHRSKPIFSMSKISMDDRDLPRKMHNGKRVKAYYAYDVTSGCVVGASFSQRKDKKLFIDCMRDMLRTLGENDMGIPMELEVEHHIVNQFKDDLMKAGKVFPLVRWCAPGNSQEKHAEHFNKSKKYGHEKRYQEGIGRWYAKLEANRTIIEKVFDELNDTYKEKLYSYEHLVAEDLRVIELYNNDMHPDQKKYPGKTRWQVLMENQNPECARYSEVRWAYHVGDQTSTKINRSQYCRVKGADYQIPSPELLGRLQPNNLNVTAYYIPTEHGIIDEVYLYQGENFICEAQKIKKYNTATAEHTSEDRANLAAQQKYVSSFDKMVKEGRKEKIEKVKIIRKANPIELPPAKDLIVETKPKQVDVAALISRYNPEDYSKQAKDNI